MALFYNSNIADIVIYCCKQTELTQLSDILQHRHELKCTGHL